MGLPRVSSRCAAVMEVMAMLKSWDLVLFALKQARQGFRD